MDNIYSPRRYMYKRKILSSYNNDIQYHLKMTQSWQYKKIHRDAKCIIIICFFIFHPHRFLFYSRNVSIVLRFLWKGKIICNDILSKSKCLPGTVKFCCRWDEKCVVPDNLRLSWQWKIRQLSRIVHIVAKINRSQH